ncbi:MAG: 4Fe-4S binding protein [Acidaminococcaceae bacterium]
MLRKVIKIDAQLCNGCGICVGACQEGAIGLVEGKATLLRDDYCDGLGNCLPVCTMQAISFEEREALAFNEAEVQANLHKQTATSTTCPGQAARFLHTTSPAVTTPLEDSRSCLAQWPVQIQLAPLQAPYFAGAHLLLAADCAAYAYGNFHRDFMQGRVTLIGCPKLDGVDYSDKLTAILQNNNIKSVTIVKMEVPCCAGLVTATQKALANCGKVIPWQYKILSLAGQVIED